MSLRAVLMLFDHIIANRSDLNYQQGMVFYPFIFKLHVSKLLVCLLKAISSALATLCRIENKQ